jgi:ribonuclease E
VLIFQDSNVIIRAIRDYFRQDISEILVDKESVYNEACDFMRQVMPQNLSKVKLYQSNVPLFSRYQIEGQIEAAFGHAIRLPSGGSLVIDHTEALVSVDINSARATKGADIEETALSTNLEAADEIARQLRLRDIGGLIVIDFIDMTPARNQREVEDRLREALKKDRARVQVGRISRFGLLEMSRQRLRPSLGDSSQMICPTCNGQGHVRGPESLALSILRVIEEESMKEKTSKILARLPLDVATFLLNEKRENVHDIEQRCGVQVVLVPIPDMTASAYHVERIRDDDDGHEVNKQASYEFAETADALPDFVENSHRARIEEPAVGRIPPPSPAPAPARAAGSGDGVFKRLWTYLFGAGESGKKPTTAQREDSQRAGRNARGGRGRSQSGERQRDPQRRQGNERRRSSNRGTGSQQGGRGRGGRDDNARRTSSSGGRQKAARQEREGGRGKEAEATPRQVGQQGGAQHANQGTNQGGNQAGNQPGNQPANPGGNPAGAQGSNQGGNQSGNRSGSRRGRRGGRGRGRGGSDERRNEAKTTGGDHTPQPSAAPQGNSPSAAPNENRTAQRAESPPSGAPAPEAAAPEMKAVVESAAAATLPATVTRDHGAGSVAQPAALKSETPQATASVPAPPATAPARVENAPPQPRERQESAPVGERAVSSCSPDERN